MLADDVEFVIGVDTHKQTHTAAVVDRVGGVREILELRAEAAGYRRVLAAATRHEGRRVWAV